MYPLTELAAIVAEMRRLGVTRWRDIELGPEPPSEAATPDEIQRNVTPEMTEQQRREERRRVALMSSGGPVRAVGRI